MWALSKEAVGGKESIGPDDFVPIPERVDVYKQSLAPTIGIYFDVIDSNHDGYIQWKEFQAFFRIFGIDESKAEESFKMIDTNGDGVLSREEFVAAALEFNTSKEDTPSKLFYGPLVE